MILTVDETSEVPIYAQLREQVVVAIADGSLGDGDPLPSTRQLAADLGVNFHTVHKAYEQLRREGLVVLNRRSGAVVRHRDPQQPPPAGFLAGWERSARTLLAEAVAQGVPHEQVLHQCSAILTAFASQAGARP